MHLQTGSRHLWSEGGAFYHNEHYIILISHILLLHQSLHDTELKEGICIAKKAEFVFFILKHLLMTYLKCINTENIFLVHKIK